MRISKKPEERRKELVEIAARLFKEKDYEEVKVSDIVTEAKVAQGTYYYYFKKKEDVVYAVIEAMIMDKSRELNEFLDLSDLSAKRKFSLIMEGLFQPPQGNDPIFELMKRLNDSMHMSVDCIRKEQIAPIITKVIREGISQGEFRPLKEVDTITRLVFDGISGIMHEVTWSKETIDEYKTKLKGIIELLEIILDTELEIMIPAHR